MPSNVTRALSTKHPRGVLKYCESINKWLQQYQLEHELDIISSHSNHRRVNSEHLRTMEQSLTQAKLQAERTIQNHSRHPWSPKLRQAQLQVYYYKSWLSQYRTGKDYTTQRSRLSINGVTLPNNKHETQVLLRLAQKQLR